ATELAACGADLDTLLDADRARNAARRQLALEGQRARTLRPLDRLIRRRVNGDDVHVAQHAPQQLAERASLLHRVVDARHQAVLERQAPVRLRDVVATGGHDVWQWKSMRRRD